MLLFDVYDYMTDFNMVLTKFAAMQTKKFSHMLLLNAAFLVLAACNNGTSSNEGTVNDSTSMADAFVNGTTNTVVIPDSTTNAAPAVATATAPATVSMAPAPQGKGGAGLNPAHGEPGHRCDIAVGAPLNSAPQTPTNTATISTSTSTEQKAATPAQQAPMVVPAPTQTTEPGMQGKPNPAHGQPGHRCDIQVGQPLP